MVPHMCIKGGRGEDHNYNRWSHHTGSNRTKRPLPTRPTRQQEGRPYKWGGLAITDFGTSAMGRTRPAKTLKLLFWVKNSRVAAPSHSGTLGGHIVTLTLVV